ncbi:hypothetical protein A3L09_02415 [Thermococcus profundus]|uniref:DUF58 domain-containing protein n=1 Tax=Thermococcus profundus TaxID=49899 RepID=A0A2Z2M9X0_THEPR|nr:DUF58 domain-containing protein [Thermococcus profundus]ASJ02199.1 hypothetical protein A3L09_02415 [Thermococcus profundus]
MRLARSLFYTSVGLALLGALTEMTEVIYLSLFPLFALAIGLAIRPPAGVAVEREVGKGPYRPGDEIPLRIRLRVEGGMGFILLRQPLPPEVELVEGSNVWAVFKGPRKLEKEFTIKIRVPRRGRYTLPQAEVYVEPLLKFGPGGVIPAGDVLTVTVLPLVKPPRRVRTVNTRSQIPIPLTSYSLTGPISTDFKEIREYRPGDPVKFINWKASARRGDVLVNEYEREGKKTVMFYVDARAAMGVGSFMENPLEYAVSLVASLAYYFLRRGYNVGLYVVGRGELLMPSPGNRQLYAMVKKLMEVELSQGTGEGFVGAFKKSERVLIQYSPLLVVVSNLLDSEELRTALKSVMKYYKGRPPAMVFDLFPYSMFEGKEVELIRLKKLAVENDLRGLAHVFQWDVRKTDVSSVLSKTVRMVR